MDAHKFKPFAPEGWGGMLSTAGFVFIGYGGLLKVASVAEEVKDPGRSLPAGMIGSWLFVTILYIAVVFVAIAVRGPKLADSLTPLSDTAAVFIGKPGQIVLSIAAGVAIVAAANAGIMAASRYPLALARDEMLPTVFARINNLFRTPHCSIILTGSVTLADFFQQAAEVLSEKLSLPHEKFIALLSQREKESSTVLNPFLAIPHIVIEGENRFELLLARAKEGIEFSENAPRVHTVFVLIGTKDERPFHLMALAAIYQIVQQDNFDKRWMSAKNNEALRDIVLLGKRQRYE